jgi:coenzyme F420-reducing hydrogenase gamma subunit
MNTRNFLVRNILCTGLVLAITVALGSTGAALAQQKGAEKLVQLQQVKTVQDLQSVEKGDMIVMSCPKCKDTAATVVEQTFKGASPQQLKTTTIHLCPSCSTKIVTKGHGKQTTDVLVHTCNTCGSKDAFCCVIKKGSTSTQGMEHSETK